MRESSSSSVPLMKGYLPVRLRLPLQPQLLGRGDSGDDSDTEDTFFFIREHQGKTTDSSEPSKTATKRSTLFVANAPVVPGVSTKLLLKSIFGRFADVTRVTAVQNPRAAASAAAAALNEDVSSESMVVTTKTSSILSWSDKQVMFEPTFLPHILSTNEGKYAHVVFSSTKEMKKAKKEIG